MAKRPVISLDADDVLWDYIGALVFWHNSKYCTNLKREDFHTYSFYNVLTSEFANEADRRKDIHDRVERFNNSRSFRDMYPMKGAVKLVIKLAEHSDLEIVTSRHPKLSEVTYWQARRDFGDAIKRIHFSYNAYTGWGKMKKGEICKTIGAAMHWDDSPKYAEECKENGVKCGIVDAPWNKGEIFDALRVFEHEEIIRHHASARA